ncbi:hypothetical protein BCY80_20220 [Yersinia pestis]|nr:hypothetical protein BCY80_20220 [Yersinia pestis]
MKRIALPIKKPEVWFWIVALLFLLAGAVLCWLVWQHPERVGLIPGTPQRDRWLTGLVVGTGILTLCAYCRMRGPGYPAENTLMSYGSRHRAMMRRCRKTTRRRVRLSRVNRPA